MVRSLNDYIGNVVKKWSPTNITFAILAVLGILLTLSIATINFWLDAEGKKEIMNNQNATIESLNESLNAKTNEIINLTRENQKLADAMLQVAIEGNSLSKSANDKLTELLKTNTEFELSNTTVADIWGINRLIESNETIKINLAVLLFDAAPNISIALLENVSDENYKIKYTLLGDMYERNGDLDLAFSSYTQLYDRTFDFESSPPYDIDILLFSSILCDFVHDNDYPNERVDVEVVGSSKKCSIKTLKNGQGYEMVMSYQTSQ